MRARLRKNLSEYKVFIVDMDGTLYSQLPVRICMAVELVVYHLFHPRHFSDLFEVLRFRKQYDRHVLQTTNSTIFRWMHQKPTKYIRLFRDRRLLSFLRMQQARGSVVVIYSDYPLDEKLKAFPMFKPNRYFSAEDEMIDCLKPDPSGLLNIVKELNQLVDDMVFIGDRMEKDGLCAQYLNMDYVILNRSVLTRKNLHKQTKNIPSSALPK